LVVEYDANITYSSPCLVWVPGHRGKARRFVESEPHGRVERQNIDEPIAHGATPCIRVRQTKAATDKDTTQLIYSRRRAEYWRKMQR
jgi:hypothetical protein